MFHFTALLMTFAATVAAMAWVYLLGLRGGFWRARERLEPGTESHSPLQPSVVAVLPARNEGAVIDASLRSLFAQDYAGPLHVILVDDGSEDGTAEIAKLAAEALGAMGRFEIVTSAPLPLGWTGKLWAVSQGIRKAAASRPDYLWLTDADIAHDAAELGQLVAKAERARLDLVSVLVRLNCESFWEKLLIPAFVFFFQMLYPFSSANDPDSRTAAAAGGSMLVRVQALANTGGIESIGAQVIDDCALARNIKKRGAIWIGLTEATASLRAYGTLHEIWGMVARSAYAQLRYSPLLLAACILGLMAVFAVPPVAMAAGLLTGNLPAAAWGSASWLTMIAAYGPTLRFYRLSPWRGVLLPLVALLYCAMTIDSARAYRQGRGGHWKGRSYAAAPPSPAQGR
jgi:hopene-associated glycosyltransferase HpnB